MTGMRLAQTLTAATATIILAAGAAAAPAVFAEETAPSKTVISATVQAALQTPAPAAEVTAATSAPAPRAAAKGKDKKKGPRTCTDPVVQILREVGFKGANVREAYAIVWRESNGHADLGPGHPQYNGSDVGLFQFNRPTFGGESWWNEKKMLDGHYNASIAYRLSKGGKPWYLWGLDGQGNTNAAAYAGIWSSAQIYAWITEPYQRYVKQFDKLPAACR